TAAVVLDDRLQVIGRAAQDKTDSGGAGMFGDIVERFLNDPVKRGLDFRGEAGRVISFWRKIRLDVVSLRPGLDQSANSFDEAKIVERSGTQLECDPMEVARGLRSQFLKGFQEGREV